MTVMNLPIMVVTCAGCGASWSVTVPFGAGRVIRCRFCPPAVEAPPLAEQMETLIAFRLQMERRYRSVFAVLDRMAVWLGQGHSDHHVCSLPPQDKEDPWRREWKCPACGLAWVKPGFYGWQPASDSGGTT